MENKYDRIGINYARQRKTDPYIQSQILEKLLGATHILNIGAGAGSYEPKDIKLTALEPSNEMISQRVADAHPVIQGYAENLPFEENAFSHVMTVLSMHHWTDRSKAFAEIKRVAREKFVAFSWNPEAEDFWLTRDYFPEITEMDRPIFPAISEFENNFNKVEVSVVKIPENCQDGFLAAYWKRPEMYLREEVRNSISTFSKLANVQDGLNRLESDLNDGTWESLNKSLLSSSWCDAGYILISCDI